MVEECHDTVGDLAETLSLLMNAATEPAGTWGFETLSFAELIENRVTPLADASEGDQRALFIRVHQLHPNTTIGIFQVSDEARHRVHRFTGHRLQSMTGS